MTRAKVGKNNKSKSFKTVGSLSLLLATVSAYSSENQQYLTQNTNKPNFITYQTHTHIKFPVELDVSYSVEKIINNNSLAGVRIVFNDAARTGLAKVDGVFADFKDERTSKIVKKIDSNNVIFEVHFSPMAKNTGMDFFNYRSRATSEVLLDYWFASANAVSKKEDSKKREIASQAHGEGKRVSSVVTLVEKQKSTLKNVEENTCPAPLDATTEQTLNYAVYHREYDFLSKLGQEEIDHGYSFPVLTAGTLPDGKPDEATHYVLALRLYKEKKYGIAVKTLDFLDKVFPDSQYKDEALFLRALALDALAKSIKSERVAAEALNIFENIAKVDLKNERIRRSRIYILKSSLLNKDYARTYALALKYRETNIEDWSLLTFMAAEFSYKISDYNKSKELYKELVAKSSDEYSVEAAYRIGEAQFHLGDYLAAYESFLIALKNNQKHLSKQPAAVFNMAECLYKLNRLSESREMYLEFKNRFRQDQYLWAAELKIPEIDRQLAAKNNKKLDNAEINKRYTMVINRHPYSPGAYVANLRLSECIDISNKKKSEFYQGFFSKKDIDKQSSALINPIELKLMSDLAEVRFYNSVGQYEKVLPFIVQYRDRLGGLSLADSFKKNFNTAVYKIVTLAGDKNNYSHALKVHDNYGDVVRTDIAAAYYLGIANANMKLGKIVAFKDALDQVKQRISTCTISERNQYHALNFEYYRAATTDLSEMIKSLSQITDDSEYVKFKYENLSELYVLSKKYSDAVAADDKLQNIYSKNLTPTEQIAINIRKINNLILLDKYVDVVDLADSILLKMGGYVELSPSLNQIRELQIEALFKLGKNERLINATDNFIKLLPNEGKSFSRLNEFEFMRAKALYSLQKIDQAKEIYRRIATADKGIWGKSAKAELEQDSFNEEQNNRRK